MKRVVIVLLFFNHAAFAQKSSKQFADNLQPAVFSLSRVMMHDVVNPPAASRFYAYAMLGAYEIVSQNNSDVPPLSTFIKNYTSLPVSIKKTGYNYQAAAVYCILETGRLMLPSGFMLEEEQKKFIAALQKMKVQQKIIDNSLAVANEVAGKIVAWSKKDHYINLSAKLRYTPVKGEGYWYPTPPAYMEAVEPNWKTIRPMMIDSCNEFMPPPPVPFSKDSSSLFYKMAREVYEVSKNLSAEQLHIASFWDCNPFVVSTSGHMAIGFKKISPGGHWMNIAGITAKQAKLDFDKTVMLQTLVGVTLMDAFISCWDEKYRSNRIRPETFINRHIDAKWQPLLQTPPFPEYTSGHSVISTASAEVMTYLLGDHFSYTDNSEEIFEIPARSFTSFRQAANEASVSRLYGGIHYRDAIDNGQDEGRRLGQKIISIISKAGIKPL
jgi:hypothetical protein